MSQAVDGRFVQGLVSGLLAALIWAAFPVVTKFTLESQSSLSAYDITALRFAVAGLILLPFLIKHFPKKVLLGPFALMVAGAGAPYVLVVAAGLNYAPAGHFGIITPSTMLVCSTLISWKVFNEKLSMPQVMGVTTILTGITLIGWQSLSLSSSNSLLGDALFFIGGILWATFTLTSKAAGIPPLQSTAIVAVLSMVLYLPFYIVFKEPALLLQFPKETLLQGTYQGVFSAVIALLLYSKAVTILGASKGALFGAVVPGTALLLAIPTLGEIPTLIEILGVCLVMGGMLLALGLFQYKIKALRHRPID